MMDIQTLKKKIKWTAAVCLLAVLGVVIYKCTHTRERQPQVLPEEVWWLMAEEDMDRSMLSDSCCISSALMAYVVDSLTGGIGPDRGVLTLSADTPDSLLLHMPQVVGQVMVIDSAFMGFTGLAEVYRIADVGVGQTWFFRMCDVEDVLQKVSAQVDSIVRTLQAEK